MFRLSHPSFFLSLRVADGRLKTDAGRLADGRLKTDSFAGRFLPMDHLPLLSPTMGPLSSHRAMAL